MKTIVTMNSKNQITIPKAARNKLAIGPRDQLILDVEKDSLILKPKPKTIRNICEGYIARFGKEWSLLLI